MVRIGLIIYLIFLGLAEPLLCPCSAHQFVSSGAEGAPCEVPMPPCCPVFPSAPFRGECPGGPQCPCRSGAETVALPSSGSLQTRQAEGTSHQHCDGSYLRWWKIALLHTNLGARADGAILSSRDRLHFNCVMRC